MNIVRFRLVAYLLLSLLDIVIFIVTLHAQLHILTGRPLSGFPKVFLFSVSAGTLSLPCLLLFQYWAPSSRLFMPIVEVAWLFVGSGLYLAGSFVILFVNVPLRCNDVPTLRNSEARTTSACIEFNTARFLWWINTVIFLVTLVVVTTWLSVQSARGAQRVWSTPLTQLWMPEPKDVAISVNQRHSFYVTTSARLGPYLGQLEQDSSEDLIYPAGPSRAAPQPRQSGEFTRAKYVSAGAGYVRANDPIAALKQINQPVYSAVPTADSNLQESGPYGAHDGAVVKSLPAQGMSGPAIRQNAPSLSAFFNPNVSSSQSSATSTRSYPYPFPAFPSSQPQSRPTSNVPSLMGQPFQTQPLDREYTPSPSQHNQKSNGNVPYNPVQAQAELFRARGNTNRHTAGTVFSLSPYYAGQEGDDDTRSVASRYSTTAMTRVNPNHPGAAIPALAPLPKLPSAGQPPPIPTRSPKRQSFTHSDTGAYWQQGPVHPLTLRRAGRNENESESPNAQRKQPNR